ncbi:MAG: DUF445 family protein [Lachnospiraceae bacterium]|nr:DUF445 family protein [Lachnospiraceae bacterium]
MDWILEPFIGAVIGCFTNFIALKMLFRPYQEVKIFGRKLPFTPGMIPKRKKEVAHAIGRVINDNLLEKDDIAEALTKETTVAKIRAGIMDYHLNIPKAKEGQRSAGDIISDLVLKLDIKSVIAEEITNFMQEKLTGGFLAMFLNEKVIGDISDQIGEWIQTYMENDGKEFIKKTIDHEIDELSDMRIEDILVKYNFDTEEVGQLIERKYKEIVLQNYETIVDEIDIAGLVEQKICEMDMAQLEQLIFAVMKKELNAIVYLGALIGLAIGFLNLLI